MVQGPSDNPCGVTTAFRRRAILATGGGRSNRSGIPSALALRPCGAQSNTVKTHLRHLYIKLAVTDRDEAVERAAELGLL